MRAFNVVFGLAGVAGALVGLTAGVTVLASLGTPALVLGLYVGVCLVSEFLATRQVLTGLFGEDEDQ